MGQAGNLSILSKDLSVYSKEKLLRSAFAVAGLFNYPIAIWKLPRNPEVHVMVAFGEVRKLSKIDLEELDKGFVISPFDHRNNPGLFIPGDFHITFTVEGLRTDFDFHGESHTPAQKAFVEQFFDQLDSGDDPVKYHLSKSLRPSRPNDYLHYVSACIEAIKSGLFQKVVPATFRVIELDPAFDPIQKLLALCDAYPNAFCSLTSIPSFGTWMGATPEMLIALKGKLFKTVALAATQIRVPERPISETAWTQKEIEEQAMVSRYIINCFKKIRLREFEEKGPKTVVAGNLLHLNTTYEVNMEETHFPELGTVMLALLHPTSAVAGMPKEAALDFIERMEGFDREFFSGFSGPVHVDGNTHIYVNLRCMQLLEKKAILYAGAGVTEDSDPQKELLETAMKFNTLLNIIARND